MISLGRLFRQRSGNGGKAVAALSRTLAVSRHKARLAARATLERLPISGERKIHLKHVLLSRIGPLVGLKRGGGELPRFVNVGRRAIRFTDERYVTLASMARGRPQAAPERGVSVIVIARGGLAATLGTVEVVKRTSGEVRHEIIVVDAGASACLDVAPASRGDIRCVRAPEACGWSGALGAGAAVAAMPYLVFLDGGSEPLPFWLSALINTFELQDAVGLVAARTLAADGLIEEVGARLGPDGSLGFLGAGEDADDPRHAFARRIEATSSGAVMMPAALFEVIAKGNDLDRPGADGSAEALTHLAFAARRRGFTTWLQPLSQVVRRLPRDETVGRGTTLLRRLAPEAATPEAASTRDYGTVGRILVLDQVTPEPDRDAGSITSMEIMRALVDLGYRVTFAPCSNFSHIPPYTDLLNALGIESLLIPTTPSLGEHLAKRGGAYDAVLIFRPKTWHDHIADVRALAPRARIIYHASDLHFLRSERKRQVMGKATDEKRAHETREAELDLLASADLCIVHSGEEARLLQEERPQAEVVCFPWIYESRGEGTPFWARKGLVFVGGYVHPPNVDAVEHYVARIHPLLEREISEPIEFRALGSFPPPSLKALERPGISVPGYIEDLTSALFEARVMVVPLRYGAGIKGKIITSLAHGLPVVTTPIGAEGMGLVDGVDALIAETPEAFASAVARLYSDPELWLRLQRAGLDYVARTTSRTVGLEIIGGMLDRLGLQRGKRSASL